MKIPTIKEVKTREKSYFIVFKKVRQNSLQQRLRNLFTLFQDQRQYVSHCYKYILRMLLTAFPADIPTSAACQKVTTSFKKLKKIQTSWATKYVQQRNPIDYNSAVNDTCW